MGNEERRDDGGYETESGAERAGLDVWAASTMKRSKLMFVLAFLYGLLKSLSRSPTNNIISVCHIQSPEFTPAINPFAIFGLSTLTARIPVLPTSSFVLSL